MSMDKVFGIAGSALAAQLVRMNTTASNLANSANTAATEEGAYTVSYTHLTLPTKRIV